MVLFTFSAFRHLTTDELRSQHQPGDKDRRRREEEEAYRKRRLVSKTHGITTVSLFC